VTVDVACNSVTFLWVSLPKVKHMCNSLGHEAKQVRVLPPVLIIKHFMNLKNKYFSYNKDRREYFITIGFVQ
jgi:hypothetical protein